MAPKKKKGKPEAIVGQYAVNEMNEAELRDFATKLNEEIERTKDKVEVTCNEKQMIELFWQNSTKQLDLEKRNLEAKQAELEEVIVDFDKLLLQDDIKLEYLEQENLQNFLQQNVIINLDRLKYEGSHFADEHSDIHRTTRKIIEMEKLEISYENLIQRMRQIRRDDVSELLEYHEKKLNQTRWRYEILYDNLWDSINSERLTLLQSSEDTKNVRIKEAEQLQSKERDEMRQYFNRIAFDCLALIGDLKRELEMLKKNEKEQKNLLKDAMVENKNLNQMEQDVADAKIVLAKYKQMKKDFSSNRDTMHSLMRDLEDVSFQKHVILQKLGTVTRKANDLDRQFIDRVRKLQQSSTLRSVFLEKKVKALKDMLSRFSQSPIKQPQIQGVEKESGFKIPFKQIAPLSDSRYPINIVDLRFNEGQLLFTPPTNL